MSRNTVDILSSYVDTLRPIIYINHFDFHTIDETIRIVAEESKAKIVEFNHAFGIVDFDSKRPQEECTLEKFLSLCHGDGYDQQTFLVLKDIHAELDNPNVISQLKWIAERNLYTDGFHTTVFIVSSVLKLPKELENYITIHDIPLPDNDAIIKIITDITKNDLQIDVEQEVLDEMAVSLKGMNEFQIRQILTLAFHDGGYITKEDKALILQEKEQFLKKSGMLELVNFKESIDDIGGLEKLKEWLSQKARVFRNLDKAIRFGVDIPKGIMIIGMPGCGKSLAAKATAELFHVPLVRLDVGRLLGKYVGESEENMRTALHLAEAISPCVLWIDEVEKAFSGVGGNAGGSEVTTRLFGQFLTWMQEKENTVFIVATANDISRIPPEFLRKGRFDELFFVDLPNEEERRKILEIHFEKRNKWNREIDIRKLVGKTVGYNGADLEAVVKETIEIAFIQNQKNITTDDILCVIKDTKCISQTLGKKIDEIRQSIGEFDFKNASNPSENAKN